VSLHTVAFESDPHFVAIDPLAFAECHALTRDSFVGFHLPWYPVKQFNRYYKPATMANDEYVAGEHQVLLDLMDAIPNKSI
jgi:hypothetical protein